MTDPDLPPLDPELDELLGEERARPGPSPEAMERMTARFEAALPPDGSDGGSDGGGEGGAASAAGAGAGAGATVSAASAAGVTFGVPGLLAALVIGAGGGALLHAELAPIPTVVTTVLVPASEAPAPPAASAFELPSIAASNEAAGPAPTPAASVEVTPAATGENTRSMPAKAPLVDADERASELAEENALISRAQSALARGGAGEALAALREHRERFSRGQLIEEREALWVQALARAGQSDAAKQRAEGFLRRFPRSVFAPAVRAAGGIEP